MIREPEHERLRRGLLAAAGAVVLVVVVIASAIAIDLFRARGALLAAQSQAQTLKSQVSDGDVRAAKVTLRDLQQSTRNAASSTDGPLIAAATRFPILGDDVRAVRTVSRVMADISEAGLGPLVGIADRVNAQSFSPSNGRIDLHAVAALGPALADADRVFTRGAAGLQGIDSGELVGPLRRAVNRVRGEVVGAQSGLRAGVQASAVLPPMLGGDGRRTYLMIFQNNAEIRSTGGLPGAYAIVSADDGDLSLGRQGTAIDFPYRGKGTLKATAEEQDLYGPALTGYWGDSNFTPDFPRTAQIMRAMLANIKGDRVDGVISVDPVALSYILRGTGPVTLADGARLTSANAVELLLHGVYMHVDPADQNAYFADAARRVFDAVSSGRGDAAGVLSGMARGVAENRIMVWSKTADEQKVLESSRIAGALPRDEGSVPHVGIYFNDATETKLEYYLRGHTTVTADSCSSDGVQTLKTRTVLRSLVPKDVKSLSGSVIGNDTGEPMGSFRMVMAIYLPYGGILTDLAIDGKPTDPLHHEHNGIHVITKPVLLGPGQEVTVTSTVVTGRGQRGQPVLRTTPLVSSSDTNDVSGSACD